MRDNDSTTILLLLIASYTAPAKWVQLLFGVLVIILGTLNILGYILDWYSNRQTRNNNGNWWIAQNGFAPDMSCRHQCRNLESCWWLDIQHSSAKCQILKRVCSWTKDSTCSDDRSAVCSMKTIAFHFSPAILLTIWYLLIFAGTGVYPALAWALLLMASTLPLSFYSLYLSRKEQGNLEKRTD